MTCPSNKRCYWRAAFSETLKIHSGDYDDPTEIGLDNGDAYVQLNWYDESGRRANPYAICIKDVWSATGSRQSFTGTAGLVFYDNFAFTGFPQVFGPVADLSYASSSSRPYARVCNFSDWRIRNPSPGDGTYFVQFTSVRGDIESVRHVQTAEVYYDQASWLAGRPTLSKKHSDTIELDD